MVRRCCAKRERCQVLQQRLDLLQVRSVKFLGGPAVDVCQQRMGCGTFALVLSQMAQAHGGLSSQDLASRGSRHPPGVRAHALQRARRATLCSGWSLLRR
jgi:hypothetical protein